MEDDYTTYLKKKKTAKNEQSRAQANETFPPRTFQAMLKQQVTAEDSWVTLPPPSSNEIGVNVGTTPTATQSSDRIPWAVFSPQLPTMNVRW